jgi:hypothetical protein
MSFMKILKKPVTTTTPAATEVLTPKPRVIPEATPIRPKSEYSNIVQVLKNDANEISIRLNFTGNLCI